MILHQMRHGRQDNHTTNHVRCIKTQGRAKPKAYRGQTKQNHILLKRVDYNAYPAKQSIICNFNFYGGNATAMHGRKGTWMSLLWSLDMSLLSLPPCPLVCSCPGFTAPRLFSDDLGDIWSEKNFFTCVLNKEFGILADTFSGMFWVLADMPRSHFFPSSEVKRATRHQCEAAAHFFRTSVHFASMADRDRRLKWISAPNANLRKY
jgi:hypothetical protein